MILCTPPSKKNNIARLFKVIRRKLKIFKHFMIVVSLNCHCPLVSNLFYAVSIVVVIREESTIYFPPDYLFIFFLNKPGVLLSSSRRGKRKKVQKRDDEAIAALSPVSVIFLASGPI